MPLGSRLIQAASNGDPLNLTVRVNEPDRKYYGSGGCPGYCGFRQGTGVDKYTERESEREMKRYEGDNEYDKWARWLANPGSVNEDQVRRTHQANPGTDRSLEAEVMWTTAHGLPY